MFVATFFALFCFAAGMAPVAIPRCCPEGAALIPEALKNYEVRSTDVLEACVPVDRETAWAPGVYVVARNAFLTPGRIPLHWQLEYSRVPACRTLRVLDKDNAFLRADNGRLLSRGTITGVALEGFCVDATVSLACAHISKCCDARSVFDGAACVADEERGGDLLRELQAIDEYDVARYGWPTCAPGAKHALVGELSAARYEDHALLLGGERFEEGAWCAEAYKDYSTRGALVFTCTRAQNGTGGHEETWGPGNVYEKHESSIDQNI